MRMGKDSPQGNDKRPLLLSNTSSRGQLCVWYCDKGSMWKKPEREDIKVTQLRLLKAYSMVEKTG